MNNRTGEGWCVFLVTFFVVEWLLFVSSIAYQASLKRGLVLAILAECLLKCWF